jgi:hypothetical protein
MVSDWLTTLERRLGEADLEDLAVALVSIAFVAGAEIQVPEQERHAAARQALLLLAAGGDPARGLDLDGPAVTALAAELETPERRRSLAGEPTPRPSWAKSSTRRSATSDGLADDPRPQDVSNRSGFPDEPSPRRGYDRRVVDV